MPLHIEIPLQRVPLRRRLAVASLLALLALLTLVLKYALEQRVKSQRREAGERTE